MSYFQFVAAPGGNSQDSAGDAEKGCERADQKRDHADGGLIFAGDRLIPQITDKNTNHKKGRCGHKAPVRPPGH